MVGIILLVFAFCFAVIAALFLTSTSRGALTIHFGWLAVAFYLLALLLGASHIIGSVH